MIASAPQPRQPAGSSQGGQYGPRTNTPPEGTLAESATGSFLYPPALHTAEEFIAFYEQAPISDRVLSNATYAFERWRKNRIEDEAWAMGRSFLHTDARSINEMARALKDGADQESVEVEMLLPHMPVFAEQARARYPRTMIHPADMRTVLRANQLVMQRTMVGPDESEQQKMLNCRVTFEGRQITAHELTYELVTHEWVPNALTENDFAQMDTLSRMASMTANRKPYPMWDLFA